MDASAALPNAECLASGQAYHGKLVSRVIMIAFGGWDGKRRLITVRGG
jgi:hypothetical protein